MARSRPAQRKQAQPESKKALVIFLVFFILTTIGGALFGYQGYTSTEGKEKNAKDAEDKAKAAEAERDMYLYEALLYRRLMGQEKLAEKGKLDQFDQQFKQSAEQWTNHKDRAEVLALRKDVEARLKMVSPDKQPPETYEKALELLTRQADLAKKDIAPIRAETQAGNKRAEDAEVLQKADKEQYDKKLADLAKKLENDQKTLIDQAADLKEKLKASEDKNAALALQLADVQKKNQTSLVAKDKEIGALKQTIDTKEAELAKLQVTSLKDAETPDFQPKAVGRVVGRKGDSVFINLGQVQRMTPQMTFSIHAAGPDGQPLPKSKGSLEVLNVFEAGSEGKIVIERSKNDPIEKEDLIVNPNWNPDRKKHVAIAGIADLTGEGRNQLREFRQLLERQNVIVDAFLEPNGNDWTVSGKGLSRETNYLILGDELPADSKDLAEASKNLTAKNGELLKQARQNGVFIVSLRNYLDMIGYQPPRGLGDTSGYRGGPVSPSEKKDPMPMPEKKDPVPMPPKEMPPKEMPPK